MDPWPPRVGSSVAIHHFEHLHWCSFFHRPCSCWTRLGSCPGLRPGPWQRCWLWPWTGQQRQLRKRIRRLPSVAHFPDSRLNARHYWTRLRHAVWPVNSNKMTKRQSFLKFFFSKLISILQQPSPLFFFSLSVSCYYHDCFLNCSTKWIFKRMFFNSHVLILKWKFVCYGAPNTPCPLCWFDLFFISSLSFSLIGCLHLSEPSLLCSSDMLSTE